MTAMWRYLFQQVREIRVNTFIPVDKKLCGTGWLLRPAVVWVIERGGVGTEEGIEEGQNIKEENSSSFPFHTKYDINDNGDEKEKQQTPKIGKSEEYNIDLCLEKSK